MAISISIIEIVSRNERERNEYVYLNDEKKKEFFQKLISYFQRKKKQYTNEVYK